MSTLSSNPGDPALRFPVTPYQEEGGYSVLGLPFVAGFTFATSVVVGVLTGMIAQWIYIVFLFPMLAGLAIGMVGAVGAKLGKLRNSYLALALGMVGGGLAMALMHYTEFVFFLVQVNKLVPGAAVNPLSPLSPFDFAEFVNQRAIAGVEIGRPGAMTNLGYFGSYIYWLLEFFGVGLFAGVVITSAAAKPFCGECYTWKQERQLGGMNLPRATALEAITTGNIVALASHEIQPGPGRLGLAVAVCPHCTSSAPVDVTFSEVTLDEKGNRSQTQLCHVTYPGEALAVLEALVERQPTQSAAPAEMSSLDRATTADDCLLLQPKGRTDTTTVWMLEIHRLGWQLIDDEGRIQANIPPNEVKPRIVFPSFWQSIAHLGILTDAGTVAWFQPQKDLIKRIKHHLSPGIG